MKIRMVLFLIVGMALFGVGVSGAEHSELKAFPDAGEGMERFILVLPEKERGRENDFKVELIPGKLMLTDGVNLVRLGSIISSYQLKGWGYTYYEVTGSDTVMSTLMAAPEGEQHVEKFVSGTPLLVRYNSRLPIVVYVPKGYKVRYRVWNAGITNEADNG